MSVDIKTVERIAELAKLQFNNEAKEKILTESEKAVQMKMFGNLTRYLLHITVPWD